MIRCVYLFRACQEHLLDGAFTFPVLLNNQSARTKCTSLAIVAFCDHFRTRPLVFCAQFHQTKGLICVYLASAGKCTGSGSGKVKLVVLLSCFRPSGFDENDTSEFGNDSASDLGRLVNLACCRMHWGRRKQSYPTFLKYLRRKTMTAEIPAGVQPQSQVAGQLDGNSSNDEDFQA